MFDVIPDIVVFILYILFLLTGGLFLLYGIKNYLLIQKIKNTPTSKARSVALGLTEVFGKAKCKEEMFSPLSKQKCVYYKIIAEYKESRQLRRKRSGARWKNIYSKVFAKPFYLEDETGRILTDPKNASIVIPVDVQYTGYIEKPSGMLSDLLDLPIGSTIPLLDKKALDFIEQLPLQEKILFNQWKNKEIRISEYVIAEDDSIYVLGTAQLQEGMERSIKNDNLVIKFGRDNIMFISDQSEKVLINSGYIITLLFIIFGSIFFLGGLFALLTFLIK